MTAGCERNETGLKQEEQLKSEYHPNSSSYPKYLEQLKKNKESQSQVKEDQRDVVEKEVTPDEYIDSLMDKEKKFGIERGFMTSKLR